MYKFVIGSSNNMETILYKTSQEDILAVASTPYILDPDQDRYIYTAIPFIVYPHIN